MRSSPLILVAVGALALTLAAVGTAVALAQEDDDGDPTFLDRVASKLGIGRDELEEAIDGAAAEEIDEAVAQGRLSEERAERLKERLADTEGFGFGHFHFRQGPVPPGKGHFGFAFGLRALHQELAAFLGIPAEQLRDELNAEGATLAEVAEAHGRSRDEVRDFILAEMTARLDEFLAGRDVDPERAERLRERLETFVDRLLDAERPWRAMPPMPEGALPPLVPMLPELLRS